MKITHSNKNMMRSVTVLALIAAMSMINVTNIAFAASPGALDNSFDGDGKVITNVTNADRGNDVAIQPDGKIVVVGQGNLGGGGAAFDFAVVRYNTDGSLDTTFDTDGKVTTDFGNIENATGVAIQSNGKIVVVGVSDPVGAVTSDFAIARYNANGSLDTTFDTDGKVITDFAGGVDTSSSVAIQSDGKIIVSGTASGVDFGIARYNTNGSLDTTFDTDGKQTVDFGDSGLGHDMALQADGKIIIAGDSNSDFALCRLNTNGSLDTTFDTDGKVTTNISGLDIANSVALQADGTIIAAGITEGNSKCALASYDSNGAFQGAVITDFNPSGNDFITDIRIQANGKIVAAVRASNGLNVLRYNANGSLDTTFGTGAKVTVQVQSSESPNAIAISGGDKIVVVGNNSTAISMIRLNINVQPTASSDFDGDGITDFSVFRPSNGTWFFLNSSNGSFTFTQFGQNGDIPVDGDFDGDGRCDVAVYRPSVGTWFMLRSTDGQFIFTQFGQTTDRPIPGDYDHDGKTDISVFRPATGQWFTLRSSDNTFSATQWGVNLDIPIPASPQ